MIIKAALLAAACALALSAWGDKPAPPATPTTTTPAEAAPATPSETPPAANDTSTAPAGDTAAPAASTAPAAGSKTAVVTDCATEIDSNDAMQYNVNAIVVPASCTEFKRSEEHTSELQSLMRNSYAVFCLKT